MSELKDFNKILQEAAEHVRQQAQASLMEDLNEHVTGTPRRPDPDNPVNPAHYADYTYQFWDIAYERWGAGALLAPALKYVLRAGRKPGVSMLEDVQKAIAYLKHLEEKLVAEESEDE